MVKNSLEALIAFHCAPTLAGIKAANLFTWHHTKEQMCGGSMDATRSKLALHCIDMEVLCQCKRYALILVYREEVLREVFTPEVECFLKSYGYAAGSSVEEKIFTLKSRLSTCGKFPHEIGLFLDYPLEDVKGFIKNGGRGYKACGVWKVYGDREKALALFERYKRCTGYFCKKIEAGHEMTQLLTMMPSFN